MKKIYITGIAGLLGVNLAYLLKQKYEIVGTDLIELSISDVLIEKIDIINQEELESSILKQNVEILIHTAAAVNVDMCEENPLLAEKLNTNVTKMITKICSENNIKLIYISTDAVFDGESERLYIENDIVNPMNVYAKTKLEGENYVLSNPNNLVLRTNIYGYNCQDKKSFGEWILYSLLNDETINLFGDIYFSPILVNEFASVVGQIIEKNLCGLYHLCGTGSISKHEFGSALKQIFSIKEGRITKTNSEDFHFKAKRSKNMGMSNEKIKQNLGINIRTPIESIEYFKRLYEEGYPQILRELSDNNAN